jgi:hypothetical protein
VVSANDDESILSLDTTNSSLPSGQSAIMIWVISTLRGTLGPFCCLHDFERMQVPYAKKQAFHHLVSLALSYARRSAQIPES